MAKPIGYTGYYPGERIPRPPGGGKPQPPITYDLNVLGQAIEEMEIGVGNIPEWTKERFTSAIESSLKATVYGGTVDASSLAAYDEEELEEEFSEISGTAGFSVNLNPADIAKDPKKWAGKLAKGAYSELTSLSDIEARKRKFIWQDIVGLGKTKDTAVRDLTKRRALRLGGAEDYGGQLNLTNIDGYEKEGKATAEKVVDFQGNVRSAVHRDKNFDDVLRTSFAGTREVLSRNVGNLAERDQEYVLAFLSKIDMVQNVQSVDKKADEIIKTVSRLRGLGAEVRPVDKEGNLISVEGSISKLQDEIDKSRAQIQLMTAGRGGLNETQLKLLGMLDERGNEVADNPYVKALVGRTGPILSKPEAAKLDRLIRRQERALNRVERAIAKPAGRGNTTLFIRNLSAASSDLTGKGSRGRYNSVERTLLRILGDEYVRGSASGVAGGERIEDIVKRVGDEGGYQYMRRTRTLLPTLEKDRQFFAIDDFMDVLYDDSFYSKFLWATKINPRLQALTPDYYVKQFMVKMHYFGLVIDEKSLIGPDGNLIKPKFFLFKWANKMVEKSRKKGGAFANKFSINIDVAGIGNRIVKGGSHFGAVQNLSKLIKSNDLNPNKMRMLMRADGIMGIQGTLARLNLPFDAANAEKFLKFQVWAKKNARRLGIDWENGEHMLEVVRGLMRYDNNQIRNIGIGITKAYRGKLSHFVQKLSVLQNKIFKGFLGKVAGKLVSWKMAVSTAISEAVMDALGVATGGAAFLAKPLQLLLQAAIRIVLDTGEKIIRSIVKADFEELSKFLDKSLTNVVKLLVQIGAAITLASVIPFFIVATLLSAISPENNAKVGGIGDFSHGGVIGAPPVEPSIEPGGCFFETGGYLSYPSFGFNPNSRTYVQDGTGYAFPNYGHGTDAYGYCYYVPTGWILGRLGPRYHEENTLVSNYQATCYRTFASNPTQYGSWDYGKAADFASANPTVYLPELGEPDTAGATEWRILQVYNHARTGVGDGVIIYRSDSTGTDYKMLILHINANDNVRHAGATHTPMYAGDNIGTLYTGLSTRPHVHIELLVNGQPVRPDGLFCR